MTLSGLRRYVALLGVAVLLTLALAASAAAAPGSYTTRGAWNFVSAPRLHPPILLTHGRTITRQLARGDFLLDNFPAGGSPGPMIGQSGPLITDNRLQPVWFQPVPTSVVSSDLKQDTYLGQPVLTWWQGVVSPSGATTRGEVEIVDQHYRKLATVRAKAPWVISLHDAVISGGDIWVTVYRNVPHRDLAPYGGSRRDTVYDAGIQEYDVKTGRLLYTWDALNPGGKPNVPLSASEQPASARPARGAAWDAYHLNSIQILSGNQVLVSMRNTWAAYLIDTTTGKILWTLGGKHSSFSFGPGARFAWQHDVQLAPDNTLTLFNDNCCRLLRGGRLGAGGQSEGMVLKLDLVHHKVALVAAYPHKPPRSVAFLGSMQLLPGGNALVGGGSQAYFSEYTKSGRQILDALFPGIKDQSYRTLFSSNWVALPFYAPHGAVRRSHGRTIVYASWNGATEVTGWQVLAGSSKSRLGPVASKSRSGFETAIPIKGTYKVFEVRALAGQRVLGISRPIS